MPPTIKLSTPDGDEVEAVEVGFKIIQEDWNEYELADGGRVRIKTIVSKVFRVLDPQGKPAFTDEGDPSIIVRHKSEVISSRS